MSSLVQRVNFYQESFHPPVIKLPLRQMLAVSLVALVLLCMITVLEWNRTRQARQTLAQMEASKLKMEQSIDSLQAEVDSIVLDTRLQQQETRLQQGLQGKRLFLNQLQRQGDSHQVQFSGYLQALANMDQPAVWLTRIVLNSPGPEISLYGVTDKPKALPDYVAQLRQEPSFRGVGFKVFDLERMEDNDRFLTFGVSTQHDESSTE